MTAKMKIKILTGIYVFILAVLVLSADLNGTRYLLGFVGAVSYADKIGHFILAGFFSLLLNLSFRLKALRFGAFNLPLGSLIVLFVVTLEECSQIYVGGRSFDKGDLIADYLGILVFANLAQRIYRKN